MGFLWFWFVFILVASILGFLQWFLRAVMYKDRVLFIQNHLRKLDRLRNADDTKLSEILTANYLAQDGVFVLRLISHNTNNITTTEIICALWDNWLVKRHKYKPTIDSDDEEDGDSTEKLPLDSPDDDGTLKLKGEQAGDSH